MQPKKNQMKMQAPDFAISKQNKSKAEELYENFFNGTKRELKPHMKDFSTISTLKRFIKKDNNDPSDTLILAVIERFQKDKIHAQVAFQICETTNNNLQSLQQTSLIKLIPMFVSGVALPVLLFFLFRVDPLNFENVDLYKFLIPTLILIPLFIWGMMQRRTAKADMIASNILVQASSAYASAKMQGKGRVGAMQNLGEMRVKAKSQQKKNAKK